MICPKICSWLYRCTCDQIASRSWKEILARANGAPPDFDGRVRRYLGTLNNLRPVAKQLALDKYFKFIFVRHPFERLVSAYHDKLVIGNKYVYTLTLRPQTSSLYPAVLKRGSKYGERCDVQTPLPSRLEGLGSVVGLLRAGSAAEPQPQPLTILGRIVCNFVRFHAFQSILKAAWKWEIPTLL